MKTNPIVYMQRALTLAARGKGRVSPNPCVGCVIVKNGTVVGEGRHAFFGGPHAEINALMEAGRRARGADMYVTLEPCTHWGKTGPCAPEVISAGLRNVHIAMLDPFHKVAGRGAAALRRAGIKVTVGLEKAAARHLNRSFITFVTKRRPHVVYKAAMTLDGKTASSQRHSRWISGPNARNLVHRLRAECDAVLIGAGTAESDNPALTSHGAGRNPVRVVLDRRLRLSPKLQIFNTNEAPTTVITGTNAAVSRAKKLEDQGVRIITVPESRGRLDLNRALRELAKQNIGKILLEGGGETAWTFMESKLIDEALFFVAPKMVGGRGAPTTVGGDGFAKLTQARPFLILSTSRVGPDLMIHAVADDGKAG